MGKNPLAAKLKNYKAGISMVSRSGLPMRHRLFGFFLAFLLLVMAGVLAVLYASGIFKTGYMENYAYLDRELNETAESLSRDYSTITVHTVELAQTLSRNLEGECLEREIPAQTLGEHPEELEGILKGQFSHLTSALERTKSSGVFLILEATINPRLESARYSRAGLLIKNMEPNVVSSSFAHLRFLRGPMSVAKENKMQVLPQWRMEFMVENLEGYALTIQNARGSSLPLSRLYLWCHGKMIGSDSEAAMYCFAPLVDSLGNVLGVCGFEVSSMLFKLTYAPQNTKYSNLFYLFSPWENNHILAEEPLLAGSSRPCQLSGDPFVVKAEKKFALYKQEGCPTFAGLHETISLYPRDSVYKEKWALALVMPEGELAEIVTGQNKQLSLFLLALVCISIAISAIVSRRYVKPVVSALDAIKTEKLSGERKTKIPEIDDLISYLAQQDEVTPDPPLSEGREEKGPLLRQFEINISSLSAAERSVFDLYMKGCTAQEIAGTLFLSINTIKTHNKRIYEKLNISSRKELMLYIQMLEESREKKNNRS